MAQGRGSAAVITISVILCFVFVAEAAKVFNVGDSRGWTFNVVGWPKGKTYRSGDTLVFRYNPMYHNVVAVNKAGYDRCIAPKGSKQFRSGKDSLKIGKGPSYFICSIPGHCESGMKISVTAA